MINVAGKICFDPWQYLTNTKNDVTHSLSELYAYLHCFLDGNVYPGNPQRTQRVIEKMLTDASLKDHVLTFSFSPEIASQFALPEFFQMLLIKGSAFNIYCDHIIPQIRLACIILVEEDNIHEKKRTILRLQRIILNAQRRIKRIQIRHRNDRYIVAISFHQRAHKRQVLEASDINDAVYKIQDILL